MISQDIYQKQVDLALTNLGKKPQNILVFYGRSGIGKKDLCDSIFESWKSQCLCALLDGEEIGENFWNALKTAVIQLRKHFSSAKDNFTCFDLAYFSYIKRVESNSPANSAEFSKRMGYAEIGDNAAELIKVLRQRDAAWEPDERRMWQVLSNCRTWDKVLFVSLMEQFQLKNWRDRSGTLCSRVTVLTLRLWSWNSLVFT